MNKHILDEASAWFVDFRVGDVDAASRERFDEWLRTSPEHVRAYIQIAKCYVDLPLMVDRTIDAQALIVAARSEPDTKVSALRSESMVAPAPTGSLAPERRWSITIGIAASLLAMLATWIAYSRDDVYSTRIGERRSITLSDGSSIDLNARSKVRVLYSKTERTVVLIEGEALFSVSKEPSRPFVVRSDTTQVRAVGTQFDVHRKSSSTMVTVLEGRVTVSQREPASADPTPTMFTATSVGAGEQVTVTGRSVTAPKRLDVATAPAWMDHPLVFDADRLTDVVEDFNRYNRRQIVIEDPDLKESRISGVYSSTDPASLLRFLCAQPGVRVVDKGDSTYITHQ